MCGAPWVLCVRGTLYLDYPNGAAAVRFDENVIKRLKSVFSHAQHDVRVRANAFTQRICLCDLVRRNESEIRCDNAFPVTGHTSRLHSFGIWNLLSLLAHGKITLNLWISHANKKGLHNFRISFFTCEIYLLLLKSWLTGAPGSNTNTHWCVTFSTLCCHSWATISQSITFFVVASVIKLPVGSLGGGGGSDGIDDKPPFRVLAFSFDSVRVRVNDKLHTYVHSKPQTRRGWGGMIEVSSFPDSLCNMARPLSNGIMSVG